MKAKPMRKMWPMIGDVTKPSKSMAGKSVLERLKLNRQTKATQKLINIAHATNQKGLATSQRALTLSERRAKRAETLMQLREKVRNLKK